MLHDTSASMPSPVEIQDWSTSISGGSEMQKKHWWELYNKLFVTSSLYLTLKNIQNSQEVLIFMVFIGINQGESQIRSSAWIRKPFTPVWSSRTKPPFW